MADSNQVGDGKWILLSRWDFPGRICLSVFCFLFSVPKVQLEAQYAGSSRNNVGGPLNWSYYVFSYIFFSLKNVVLSGLKKYMLYLLVILNFQIKQLRNFWGQARCMSLADVLKNSSGHHRCMEQNIWAWLACEAVIAPLTMWEKMAILLRLLSCFIC